ncbi:MAG: hypothetical protein IKQ45_00470 [Clostridia bacterium]|nr:hypothetical protein [Clostridia bacterium]
MGIEFFSEGSESLKAERYEGLRELEPGVSLEHVGPRQAFRPEQENFELSAGTPEKDAEHWHRQGEAYSCAVVCQEFVAEQLLDRDFSEQSLIEFAKERGWYDPESGTTANDVGKILESLGIHVERAKDLNLRDLAQELDSGAKLICGVNSAIMAKPELAEVPGFNINHAVEVIGIKQTPSDTWVILNDPGLEGGRGVQIRASTFLKAWKPGNNYTVIARKGGINA